MKNWEKIDDHSARLKVPGGWLVRVWRMSGSYDGGISLAVIFVADTLHEWRLGE